MCIPNAFPRIIYLVLLTSGCLSVEYEHFWGHGMHGASCDTCGPVAYLLTQAEVDQGDLELVVEEDVSSFQVLVQDALLVKSVECDYKLDDKMADESHKIS